MPRQPVWIQRLGEDPTGKLFRDRQIEQSQHGGSDVEDRRLREDDAAPKRSAEPDEDPERGGLAAVLAQQGLPALAKALVARLEAVVRDDEDDPLASRPAEKVFL